MAKVILEVEVEGAEADTVKGQLQKMGLNVLETEAPEQVEGEYQADGNEIKRQLQARFGTEGKE